MFAFNVIWPSFYDAPFFEFFNSIQYFCSELRAVNFQWLTCRIN